MDKIILKKQILEDIKDNGALFGKIADALKISPISLPRLIYSNDEKLTQAAVLRILCEHLKIENQEDLLEVITESENNNNTNIPQLQEIH